MMNRKGLTLVEILIAAVMLATVVAGMALFQTATLKVSTKEKDRAVAMQRAVQMMEEVLAYQVTSGTQGETSIDALAQSENDYSFNLTIDPKVLDPKLALSGNIEDRDGFRFVRQIRVEPIANERGARRVSVAVFYSDGGAQPNAKPDTQPLAFVTNIVKAGAVRSQQTQVYDMYIVDIENARGVWTEPNTLREILDNTLQFLESNNPGLEIREHWVRRLAYGRDPYYTPIGNRSQPTSNAGAVPLNWTYFYPGKLTTNGDMRYNPDVLKGQLRVDDALQPQNGLTFGSSTANYYTRQPNYTFADQFNHAVPYAQEEEKYAAACAVARAAGKALPEMSLRMLLEKLAAGQLKNAIIVNIHGELIPVIPMRNYADAARVPRHTNNNELKNLWGVDESGTDVTNGSALRLVTHPRRQRVDADASNWAYDASDTVDLHVYPFATANQEADEEDSSKFPDKYREAQIVLRGVGDKLKRWWDGGDPTKNIEIQTLVRVTTSHKVKFRHQHLDWQTHYGVGWHRDNNLNQSHEHEATLGPGYHWVKIWPDNTYDGFGGAYYSSDAKSKYFDGIDYTSNGEGDKDLGPKDIVIKLKDIPYTHKVVTKPNAPGAGDDQFFGLPADARLHKLNYFPDPALPDFTNDIPKSGTAIIPDIPRNTARFRIRYKVQVPGRYEVLTTIGDEDDLRRHQAPNRSITYQYVGTTPPFSEQYQFVGDPRHNPYEDVRNGHRYNRHFANFKARAYTSAHDDVWNKFTQAEGGWVELDADFPRYMELWRRALVGGNGLFVNPAGFSFYYTAQGGEVWEDVAARPYTGGGGVAGRNEITLATTLPERTDNSWYALPWIGELFPDDQWSNWQTRGNLPASDFRRQTHSNLDSYMPGGAANPNHSRYTGANGSVSFFNGGTAGTAANWFVHQFLHGDSVITGNGASVANAFKLYLNESYPSYRPFTLEETSIYEPPDWTSSESNAWRTKLEWGLLSGDAGYYKQSNSATHMSVAPIVIRRDDPFGNAGYAVMNGAAPSADSGTTGLARLAIASSMQAFFDLAAPNFKVGQKQHDAIKLLPRLSITAPAEDSQLTGNSERIEWRIDWTRWNNDPYSNHVINYGASAYRPAVVYNIKYSTDGGASWKFINGSGTALPGVYEPTRAITGTASGGTFNWNYAGWPNKEYLVRLEAYRDRDGYRETHYAFHQMPFAIAH